MQSAASRKAVRYTAEEASARVAAIAEAAFLSDGPGTEEAAAAVVREVEAQDDAAGALARRLMEVGALRLIGNVTASARDASADVARAAATQRYSASHAVVSFPQNSMRAAMAASAASWSHPLLGRPVAGRWMGDMRHDDFVEAAQRLRAGEAGMRRERRLLEFMALITAGDKAKTAEEILREDKAKKGLLLRRMDAAPGLR